MQKWTKLSDDKIVYDGWRKVRSAQYRLPNGTEAEFEVGYQANNCAVAVLALTPDNNIVLARQYRVGPDKIMDELPGGGLDKDEPPEVAAKRELLEETGYETSEIEHLGTIYKHAWLGTVWEYFIAFNCTLSGEGQNLDEREFIEVVECSIEDLLENAKHGRMTDVEAVFLAYDRLKEIQGEIR